MWAGWDAGGVGGDRERVRCAMGVGASTLGAGVRVKLTLWGVGLTLGDRGGRDGLRFGRRGWLGMGVTVGSAVGYRAGD